MPASAVLQLIGNATSNGTHAGPFTFTGTGLTCVSSASTGVFTVTVDPGLIGDNATALQSRVVVTPLGGAGNSNIQVAKSIVNGLLTLTLTAFVGAVATDGIGFDIQVFSNPST